MNKRIIGLALLMMLVLSGCSNGNNNGNQNNANQNNQATEEGVAQEDQEGMGNIENLPGNGENISNNNASNGQEGEYVTEHVVIENGQEALARLKEGNQRFLNDESILINVTDERRDVLEGGQDPYVVMVSCSDSRVTPTTIFNAGLGEIFDIRLAGNILNEDALGSIEYGVEHLHAPLLVIMGHQNCGAVTAAYDKMTEGSEVEGNINALVDKIQPAITEASGVNEAIHMNVDYVTEEVMKDEIVKHLVESGDLMVVKAFYKLDGSVTFVNADESITDLASEDNVTATK